MAVSGVVFLNTPETASIDGDLPLAAIGLVFLFAAGVTMFCTIPSVFAAFAFLRRRSWAKVAGIIAAVSISMSFPLGTAIAAYTFWFLFSESGKQLYDGVSRKAPTIPPPPPTWAAA